MTSLPLFQNLDTLPRLNQTHQWADYVELLALTSEDKSYSQAQLQDTEGEIEDVAVDMEDVDFDEETISSDPDFNIENSRNFNGDEKLNRRWADIKTCLHSRHLRLGDAWPFELKDDVLYATASLQNSLHRLYTALLLASALKYILKTRHKDITTSLEEIGYRLFCYLMPMSQTAWIVKPFGAHQRIANSYQGTLFNKISQLAKDLNTQCVAQRDDFKPGDSGDGGLDLVAWHPMGDKLGYIPIAFAQCGCSLDDLKHKQLEAHPANWRNKIQLQNPPTNYYFAPHDLRQNSGRWDEQLGEVIMLDRARIIHLAKVYKFPAEYVDWSHVDEAINTRRSFYSLTQ
jgi:hypothetical protein